nr:TerD family protein [uncultured Campylobacter sp.]
MAVNLSKGGRVSLSKEAPGLSKILVGLGWDTNTSDTGAEFDLDASAFLVGASGKVENEKNFVFYNNLVSADGSVVHTGDNRTGGRFAANGSGFKDGLAGFCRQFGLDV